MAYRDPTFNANLLTDLLGTYLTHNSQEREKYYKAEQQGNRPQYRTVDGNLVSIGRDGQITTLMTKKVEEKEPKFEDFPEMDAEGNPTGRIIKGKFVGGSKKDPNFNIPMGYEGVGIKQQFKQEDKEAKKRESIEDKNIRAMVSEAKRLRNLKDKNFDYITQQMIKSGMQPPAFTTENQAQLDFYENKLSELGFDRFGFEKSTSAPKQKTRKKITY